MKENIKYAHNPNDKELSFQFDHVHIFREEQISLHQQITWELSYVITGRGIRIIGDTVEPFSQGEVILIPPNIPHYWSFEESVHYEKGKIENITITFTDGLMNNVKKVFPELAGCISQIQKYTNAISFEGEILSNLQIKMTDMVLQTDEMRVSMLIQLFALMSVSEKTSVVGHPVTDNKQTQRMQSIRLYVMNNYQHDITLDDISKFVYMEKSSFCIFFKRMTGKSFFSFLMEYRIESSCNMLSKTNMSISEICYASGFRDIPYYNRVFKKIMGITPSTYKNNNNG
jgi:YesN/AraC family two-component response regulator